MPARFLTVCLALLLVSACGTTSDRAEEASATGAGAGQGPGTSGTGQNGSIAGVDERSLSPLQRELEGVGSEVYFAYDEYTLSPEARNTVERQADLILGSAGENVVIVGHTDSRGTREYNLALGERRANAVRDYLVTLGVEPFRITTLSYGEERPAVVGSSEEVWARNRRAVTAVTGRQVGS